MSDSCRNFLFTLMERGDLGQLPAIVDWMAAMASGGPQVRMAIVTTAYAAGCRASGGASSPPSSRPTVPISAFPSRWTRISSGGAVVRIGDQVVDGSVRARLQAIDGALVQGN